MRRVFWLLVGIGLGVIAVTKWRSFLNRLTPAGVAEQVEEKGKQAASSLGEMYAAFRTAMAEREAELREELG